MGCSRGDHGALGLDQALGALDGLGRVRGVAVGPDRVGVLRSADGLAEAADRLAKLAERSTEHVDQDAWETTNLLTISTAMSDAAARREETRGSHWRDDFPDRREPWQRHLLVEVEGEALVQRLADVGSAGTPEVPEPAGARR